MDALKRKRNTFWCLLVIALNSAAAGSTDSNASASDDSSAEQSVFRIAVFGDSFAEGYWRGFRRTLKGVEGIEVVRRSRAATSLARPDFFNWSKAIDKYLAEAEIDFAIVALGANDAQSLYNKGTKGYRYGTDEWNDAYSERVEEYMQRFVTADIDTLWVGFPIVRSSSYAKKLQHLNEIHSSIAEQVGISYFSLWPLTTDEKGEYSSVLKVSSGRAARIRGKDGIHFSSKGEIWVAEMLLRCVETLSSDDSFLAVAD